MNTTHIHSRIGRYLKSIGLGAVFGMTLGAPIQAAVNISDVPLFLGTSVDPNIMFILDDSGSMHFEFMPDEYTYWGKNNGSVLYVYPRANGVYGGNDYNNRVATVDNNQAYNALARSSSVNKIYYNPAVTYTPWAKHDATLYPNASLTCALHNPERIGTGADYCRDLTADNSNYNNNSWNTCNSAGTCASTTSNKTFWPATYYWYKGGDIWTWGNYDKVEIKTGSNYTGHGRTSRTDCAAAAANSCTYAEEIQNFANWYTYYRSRVLAARAGIGRAFSEQGEGMRVGFGAINKSSASIDGVATETIIRGVRPFSGTNRENFFTNLYTHVIPNSGTPLRAALDDAGQYFSRSDNSGPWGANPGTNDTSAHLQCRQNYTILMTDGYWSGGSTYQAGTSNARNNNDNTNGPTITGPNGASFTYSAVAPFADSVPNTLADVAMYYWKNDLRTDLTNEVPITAANPAFWQHMVTFGVGMGVEGSIDPDDAIDAISDNSTINWPDPVASTTNCTGTTCGARIDDLLHAAVNSRGGFFSAADPTTFATELSDVLSTIVARVDSASTSAAASSATLQTDTLLYTAGFRSSDWSGELKARYINADGTLGGTKWEAESKLITQVADGSRKIFTSNRGILGTGPGPQILASSGVALNGALHANQTTALNSNPSGVVDGQAGKRIAWLYGTDDPFLRSRVVLDDNGNPATHLLGDITNSNPQFAGKGDFGYRRLTDHGASYLAYRTSSSYQNRPDILYVGANDGMLHGFDAQTGVEHFAYIPSQLLLPEGANTFAAINSLMDKSYSHRYYTDGTATIADAYVGSWKSILVGTMGVGGRTVFALDVSNPAGFGAGHVLWEFTDPDLGYGVTKPAIVRMSNGEWAAVFGNGYNSNSHKAMLFIVSLSDGTLLKKIDTGSGSAGSPNGLAAPTAALEIDGLSATTIYAGDLQGQLWRFDVSDALGTWNNSNKRSVLFTAKDSGGTIQPITSAPEVAVNPNDTDTLMVLFGTGSYFRDVDGSSTQVQSLYGIIDDNGAAVTGRGQLRSQTITWQGSHTFTTPSGGSKTYTLREVSDNPILTNKGWYLDLLYGTATGERVTSQPTLLSGAVRDRVRFSTMIPETDPCASGEPTGFIMDIMLASGGRAGSAVFDLNGDGLFDVNDNPNNRIISGIGMGGGEEPIVIQDGDDKSKLFSGDGDSIGASEPGTPTGRQSWRQLR